MHLHRKPFWLGCSIPTWSGWVGAHWTCFVKPSGGHASSWDGKTSIERRKSRRAQAPSSTADLCTRHGHPWLSQPAPSSHVLPQRPRRPDPTFSPHIMEGGGDPVRWVTEGLVVCCCCVTNHCEGSSSRQHHLLAQGAEAGGPHRAWPSSAQSPAGRNPGPGRRACSRRGPRHAQ